MNSYPPALRRTGFVAPQAIRHFGLVAMEARATKTRAAVQTQMQPAPELAAPHRRAVVRLWLPLTPLFLLLAPFAILLIPFCYLAPPLRGMNCAAAVFAIGRTLLSIGGTDVHIETRDALVRIKIL